MNQHQNLIDKQNEVIRKQILQLYKTQTTSKMKTIKTQKIIIHQTQLKKMELEKLSTTTNRMDFKQNETQQNENKLTTTTKYNNKSITHTTQM